MGWSRRVPDETYLETMRQMLEKGANVRRGASGALALAYVADGRSDAYVELHMNAWDCLAGLLLVAEAGGEGDLAAEALGTNLGGTILIEDLEGDWPVVGLVVREVDRGHAPRPELALDAVGILEFLGQRGCGIEHSAPRSGRQRI